ncbi:MAG: isopenicillin N synthase family oxygenase [Myxococcales bacterium]|nr:isopenicillin N synthase family oxygenase [Myxococcales bacterium]
MQNIPVVDLADWYAEGPRRSSFVEEVGRALTEIGFFAVRNHNVSPALTEAAYRAAQQFFQQAAATKVAYFDPAKKGQRGFTGYGREHARDSAAPDLKEFWQIGRPNVPDDHPVHRRFGPNVWPDAESPRFRDVMTRLYGDLEALGQILLEAAALHLGEAARLFRDMVEDSDTIVRVLFYPPVGAEVPAGAVRSAAHEDINLITLLSGATAEGLELLRRDGTWMPVHTGFDTIVVDAGDMLQNLSNGLYRSTTHRVVNPSDAHSERYSMPCFIHPRAEVDLSPLPSCVQRTGGLKRYPDVSAGQFLAQRLREIGLG